MYFACPKVKIMGVIQGLLAKIHAANGDFGCSIFNRMPHVSFFTRTIFCLLWQLSQDLQSSKGEGYLGSHTTTCQ